MTEHGQGQDASDMHLTGKLLIAMPGMSDPRFEHSVVLLCSHSPDGSMGFILNKPMTEVTFADLIDSLSLGDAALARELAVRFGGPVETGRGFVLHSVDYLSPVQTMEIAVADAMIGLTATIDVLEKLAVGRGPERALLALGYAGWGAGQLEAEIAQNAWLTSDVDADLIFSDADAVKWERALAGLGVDALTLSSVAGRA